MTVPETAVRYPPAERLDLTETRHGLLVADPYRWLEDPADPGTLRWMAEQDRLLAAHRATWPVEDWAAVLAELAAVTENSPPVMRRGTAFSVRRRAAQEHPTLLVRTGNRERVLVDPLALDPTGETILESWRPSVEGERLAYQLSGGGTEDCRLWVVDVATGQVLDGPIDRVRRSPIAWLPGGTHYYYVRRLAPDRNPGEERYHRRVYLHRVGSDPGQDVLIFGEGRDKTQFYSVDVTADGRWLQISASAGTDRNTDIWLADLTESSWPEPALRCVQEAAGASTAVHIAPGTSAEDPVWLRTTRGAPGGRIMTVTAGHLSAPWRELIAEHPGTVLTDLAVLDGPEPGHPIGLVTRTRHALSEVTVHDLSDGRELGTVPLPGAGTVGRILTRRDGGHDAWFVYSDHQTPPTVMHFDARSAETRPWDAMPPAGASTAGIGDGGNGIRLELAVFASRDGTPVRMFIASGTGRPDRPRPAILTGYGGFGVSMTPGYSPDLLAWVRAGGVFAIACLRGGGEEGELWHRSGQGRNKQNVFDDFDAATDHLVDTGWTSPDRLGILGASNGGLLVGAALTQHPQKYAAAVCMSGLLDMARYELSGLGPSWRSEYGSADDPADFRTLLGYSPYHRVAPLTAYPPVLLTVAGGDSRVDPLHSRKMCAALQFATSGPGPVLFQHEHGVGHGAWARSRAVAVQADHLAFLATHLGLNGNGIRP